MAIKTKLCGRFSLATLLALAMMLWVTPAGNAQTTPAANPPTAEPAPLPTPPTARPVGPTPRPAPLPGDITAREVAEMNQFLDSHPEIAEQLRKDPSLVDNQRWVADHPALQAYLQEHPRVADAFRTSPNLFMRDEGGYNRDVADMSRFLQSHPEIAAELRRDPRLIDNRDWVANHPALQEYLQNHPQITAAFRADPGAFMQDENRDMRDDITRADVTEMGRFLASHPEINEQLRKDPSLIDNRKWVSDHPALQEYCKAIPRPPMLSARIPASSCAMRNATTGKMASIPSVWTIAIVGNWQASGNSWVATPRWPPSSPAIPHWPTTRSISHRTPSWMNT